MIKEILKAIRQLTNDTVECGYDTDLSGHVITLLDALEVGVKALEGFQLCHTHSPEDKHMRRMGDNYGWCDFCQTKMCYGEDDAKEALAAIDRILKGEK